MIRNKQFYRNKEFRRELDKILWKRYSYNKETLECYSPYDELWEYTKERYEYRIVPSDVVPEKKKEIVKELAKHIKIQYVRLGYHPYYTKATIYEDCCLDKLKERYSIVFKNLPLELRQYGYEIKYNSLYHDFVKDRYNEPDPTLYKLDIPYNWFQIKKFDISDISYRVKKKKGNRDWDYLYHYYADEVGKMYGGRRWNRKRKYPKRGTKKAYKALMSYEDNLDYDEEILETLSPSYTQEDIDVGLGYDNWEWWLDNKEDVDDGICKWGCYDNNMFI